MGPLRATFPRLDVPLLRSWRGAPDQAFYLLTEVPAPPALCPSDHRFCEARGPVLLCEHTRAPAVGCVAGPEAQTGLTGEPSRKNEVCRSLRQSGMEGGGGWGGVGGGNHPPLGPAGPGRGLGALRPEPRRLQEEVTSEPVAQGQAAVTRGTSGGSCRGGGGVVGPASDAPGSLQPGVKPGMRKRRGSSGSCS